jgi:single-strand DNA-binding protein
MLNSVVLIGRMTKDPELRYSQAGKGVAKFTLAVDRPFKNANGEKEADFINCVQWGKGAEITAQYTAKGSLVAVEGRLQVRSYDKDGQRRWVTEVIADNVRFLDRRKEESIGQEVEFNEQEIPF